MMKYKDNTSMHIHLKKKQKPNTIAATGENQ